MPLTVYKRGQIYHVRGTVAGQRIRESTNCSKRGDANAWAIRRQAEIQQRHALGTAATITFGEAALDYINAGGETRFLTPILEHLGAEFKLSDLDNAKVNELALALYPTAAPATINRQLITPIRAIYTLAAEEEKATFKKFRSRKEPQGRTRWLRPAEMERLLDSAGSHLAPIIATLVGTGARVSEILLAEVSEFYPHTGEIWLDDTKNDWPRMLRMPARSRDLILQVNPPATGRLLRRPDGQAYQVVKRGTPIKTAFNRARDAADLGPDVTPHVLRHTWATWYYAATKDYGGLLDRGGWRTSDLAQRYRKMAPDNLADDLLNFGWDFTRLGRDVEPPARSPHLKAV